MLGGICSQMRTLTVPVRVCCMPGASAAVLRSPSSLMLCPFCQHNSRASTRAAQTKHPFGWCCGRTFGGISCWWRLRVGFAVGESIPVQQIHFQKIVGRLSVLLLSLQSHSPVGWTPPFRRFHGILCPPSYPTFCSFGRGGGSKKNEWSNQG